MLEKTIIQKLVDRDGEICGICGKSIAEEMALYREYNEFNMEMKRQKKLLQKKIKDFRKTHVAVNIDHIIPKSKGGESGIENYQLAHMSCNSDKGNKIINESKESISK